MDYYQTALELTRDGGAGLFVQSVAETARILNFRSLLDFSYNKNVSFSSDYGGEHDSAIYNTYTFMFQSYKSHENWNQEINRLREEKNYATAPQYKEIKAETRKRKLADWLETSITFFRGFVASFAVPKYVPSLFAPSVEELHTRTMENPQLDGCCLSPKVLEKAYRVTFFSSLMLGPLLENGAGYFWMTDRDSIAQDEERFYFTARLQTHFLNSFFSDLVDIRAGYSKPWSATNDSANFSENFLTLSDLFSGALSDFCDKKSSVTSPEDLYSELKPKTIELIKNTRNIPVLIYAIDRNDRGYYCTRWTFEVEE
ncbi:MAG: hypothetical protein ACLP5H_24250 [Desulfomonilaceae bacterium]